MTDCILALQQCSLIGLDDSPDLLRHSILHRDGSENVLLWNSKESSSRDVVQRLAFTPAAAVHSSSTSNLARAIAACELSLKDATGTSILDCSLPLFSESPAIAGKQLPRSRIRNRVRGGAAGGTTAQNSCQPSILQQQEVKQAAAAVADGCLDDSNASSHCMHSFSGILTPAAASNNQHSQQQEHHSSAGKENQCPAAADPASDTGKPTSQQGRGNDLAALQALLEDSCCSAASLLHPSLATLPYTVSAPGAAAGAGSYCCSIEGLRCSSFRTSMASDVSEFQGFWLPRSAARSPFSTPCTNRTAADPVGTSPAVMPTPTRLLLTAGAGGCAAGDMLQADGTYYCNGAQGSLECLSSCESWQAGDINPETAEVHQTDVGLAQSADSVADVAEAVATPAETADSSEVKQQQQQQQQQQGWDQLLLLLSLDESVSLMQVASGTCNISSHSTANTSPVDDGSQGIEYLPAVQLQRPTSAEPEAADGSDPASLSELASPMAGLLRSAAAGSSSWGGFEEGNARYNECCLSPASPGMMGSPTVLLSSPVCDSTYAADSCGACGVPARTHSVLKQHTMHAGDDNVADTATLPARTAVSTPSEQSLQHPTEGVAAGDGPMGMAGSRQQQQQQPNAMEFSPIRGVTLWTTGTAIASPIKLMASPNSMPLGKHPEQQEQEQKEVTLTPNAAAGSGNSPQWHVGQLQTTSQQQQPGANGSNALLQQLLDDSCDSWVEPTVLYQRTQQAAPAGEAAYSSMQTSDTPLPSGLQYATPQPDLQHCQAQTGSAKPAGVGTRLSGSLRLQLPEHQGRSTQSLCASPAMSPAESIDSFTVAAAGNPYGSCSLSPTEKAGRKGSTLASILDQFGPGQQRQQQAVDCSQGWRAYEGLEVMLTPGGVATPDTVVCKNGWGQHAAGRAADAGGAMSTPEPFVDDTASAEDICHSVGKVSPVRWQQNPSAVAGDSIEKSGTAMDDHAGSAAAAVKSSVDGTAADAAAVQDLAVRLAAAESDCTKHQQEAMQARQVALEKELELQVLRSALKLSEVEGSSCLDALAATIDIIATADGSTSVTSSMEFTAGTAALTSGTAAAASHADSSSNGCELRQEVEQLQEQNAALQQHNAAMQATMAEAAQQLDLLEARVSELSADKEAAEALLLEAEQQWNEQLKKQEEFTQSELDEQQQQHEEEFRQLHDRLDSLAGQLQAAQQELTVKAESLQQHEAELAACKQELMASQQEMQQLQELLDGKVSESAASTEQLQRQVQQLTAAKRELQETNARLVDAEAEYASNQLTLGCRNQELSAQLKDAQAANKELECTVQQLQTQNSSLSQMCQALKASATSGQTAAAGMGHPSANDSSAAPSVDAGPTPMRRRMAAANAQLERRCQQLLEQKQQLAVQLQQLQAQQQQQGANDEDAAATVATIEQQQVLLQELQAQVEHLSACNDELLAQLQDLDYDHQQVLEEREQLLAQIVELEQSLARLPNTESSSIANEKEAVVLAHDELKLQLRLQQQQCDMVQNQLSSAQAAAATAAAQQQEELDSAQAAAGAAAAQCQQLKDQLTAVHQQLEGTLKQRQHVQQQDAREQQLQMSNTALFERCQELEAQLQQLQSQLQLQQREYEQRLAAAAALGVDTKGSGRTSAADSKQSQLVAELRGRLKDVLDLLEDKQLLQKQQAEQFAAREAELTSRCSTLAAELQQVQQQLSDLQAQHAGYDSHLASMTSARDQLQQECSVLRQQLAAAEAGKAAADQAAASAAMTAVESERAATAAERSVAELERALERLQAQNQGLVEQVVQLQLVDPAAGAADNSSSIAVQVNLTEDTAADGSSSARQRKRWTSDQAVQVDLGATPEQAAAVQQLLLLQAQQQLQDMEQQNQQAAERLVQSKARMAELQTSIQKQEDQLKTAEQQLAQATRLHKQQTTSLQGENEQLIQQLTNARKQLKLLQTANDQLEAKALQQQHELEKHQQQLTQKQQELQQQQQKLLQQQSEMEKQSAALDTAQQQVQSLQQQQTLDKLQVATAAAELHKAKERAQQLLQAKDKEATEVVALQQQVQQLHLQRQQQQQVAASMEAAATAAAAQEAAVREELGKSQQQLQVLLKEKDVLVVELQQTKVAVDFLEDSVRRLGQHNASLVQQLQDTIAAAATAAEATKANSNSLAVRPAGQPGTDVAAGSGPVSPRTLQQIITAATRVNEKNKRLKKELQAMQGSRGS